MQNSFLQSALELAAKGFKVFPLAPGSKLPYIDDFTGNATTDPEKIRFWWMDEVLGEQPLNIGISTQDLVVIDVDNKDGKNGSETLFKLEAIEGLEVPPTYTQTTPTGGRHLVYSAPRPLKQGAGVLGEGVDIRARGGYIVGAGSVVSAGTYRMEHDGHIVPAPEWLIQKLSAAPDTDEKHEAPAHVDLITAAKRAAHYLTTEAPLALEGNAGDETTFKVAARVRDFGVSEAMCLELMSEHWNDRCEPPWEFDALERKVKNAYNYAARPVGNSSPESDFPATTTTVASSSDDTPDRTLHPIEELNKKFAFVMRGGQAYVMRETKSPDGHFEMELLTLTAFHALLRPVVLQAGKRTEQLSELWMASPKRRTFDGFVFLPGKACAPNWYNLWRGFAFEPVADGEPFSQEALDSLCAFQEHVLTNICDGDFELYEWVIGYFAHMIQKPWEKPLTALVFKGKKGSGKTAMVERIAALVHPHYGAASDKRYLVGNFNAHLENKLMFTLEEAFWSGDKQAEGVLKDLITSQRLRIERKGMESHEATNYLRVMIIGNEDWVVPASADERRYAVFNVGDGRLQDREFFRSMRVGMERGGYRLLMRYLLNFDISGIDVDQAPQTQGLIDQKTASLPPFYEWWQECLEEGSITGGDFVGWPESVSTDCLKTSYKRYRMDRDIRSRGESTRRIKALISAALGTQVEIIRPGYSGYDSGRPRCYRLPTLEESRAAWERFIKAPPGTLTWQD